LQHATEQISSGRPAVEPTTRKSGDLPPCTKGVIPRLTFGHTEGEKLMTNTLVSNISANISERLVAGFLALAFGLLLLAASGFAGSDYVHNAAHDTRHAIGFPCH
jgi:cobalt transporter subunit CbtB